MFFKVITGIVLLSAIVSCDDHGHGHSHGGDSSKIFDNILDHLNTTLKSGDGHRLVSIPNLEKLLQDLNFRACTGVQESSERCNLVSKLNIALNYFINKSFCQHKKKKRKMVVS